MTAIAYCTTAELRQALSDKLLGELIQDQCTNTSLDWEDAGFWTDSGITAMLTMIIADGSAAIDEYVAGRVDVSDTDVLATLKRYAIALISERLWARAGHAPKDNPHIQAATTARARLREIREGKLSAGASEQPQRLGWSSSEDDDPAYNKAAEGGNGEDSTVLEGF